MVLICISLMIRSDIKLLFMSLWFYIYVFFKESSIEVPYLFKIKVLKFFFYYVVGASYILWKLTLYHIYGAHISLSIATRKS